MEKKLMSIATLQKKLQEREAALAGVQQQKTKASQQIAALEAERSGLVVAARTGEQTAKKRVAEIDQECIPLQRGIHDDDAAIPQLNQQIETVKEQIAAEEKEAERDQVRTLATAAAKRARENAALAMRLCKAAAESLDELHQLGRKAAVLDLRFPSYGPELNSLIAAFKGTHVGEVHVTHLAKLERVASQLEHFADSI
jgi:chromosome segregation ATPase